MALPIPTTAPSASSPDYWAHLLFESTLPESTLDALAAELLQATSVQSFCYGMRTRDRADEWCSYALFTAGGPPLAVNGAPEGGTLRLLRAACSSSLDQWQLVPRPPPFMQPCGRAACKLGFSVL